jgi:hypothetical protein
MRRAGAVGCAAILIGNLFAVSLIAYLAARAGMIFPADCGVGVSPGDCSAIHTEAARPVTPVILTVLVATIVADYAWLLWVVVDRSLTERQY